MTARGSAQRCRRGVIPAQAGIQKSASTLGCRLRGNDRIGSSSPRRRGSRTRSSTAGLRPGENDTLRFAHFAAPVTSLEDFANRVHKNARHFGKWARRRGHRGLSRVRPRHPRVRLCARRVRDARPSAGIRSRRGAGRQRTTKSWVQEVHAAAADALGMAAADVVLKLRAKRHGHAQHEKTGVAGTDFVVTEGGHRFIVNLHAYLDTGLFLDHRDTRALVQSQARGKRVPQPVLLHGQLHGLRGSRRRGLVAQPRPVQHLSGVGAAQPRAQPRGSGTAPARARRRARLAGAVGRESERRFDLIVLDPPSFSASKSMQRTLDIQRDHPELLERCGRLLAAGRGAVFLHQPAQLPSRCGGGCGLQGEEISARTVPEDFRNRRIHRCWQFSRR